MHPEKEVPDITDIYVILQTNALTDSYEEYLRRVDRGLRLLLQPANNPGNETYRWHGTSRACQIGELGITKPCINSECGVCGIIKTSFDLKCYGKATKWGRFGKGIYTTDISSKSDDYVLNQHKSFTKALVLASVVLGHPKKLRFNSDHLVEPPGGYDSVIGEPSEEGDLRYSESVVYDEDAIRPVYLVMYSSASAKWSDGQGVQEGTTFDVTSLRNS
ncbi:hypothetical protein FRC17_006442 [Serendipita sp. 399]|nr:hypothetical protein FRC17_006442 [Serendipita sp. 399]